MKKRRAFLASAAAVAGSGCLGQITADPVFVLDAKTVERTESALVPKVSVVDEEATEASPATFRLTLYNQSLQGVNVKAWDPRDGGGNWGEVSSAVSEGGRMQITDPNLAERVGQPPCWFAPFPLQASAIVGVGVSPLGSQRRTFAVGAASHGDCLEPGSYRFEQRYSIDATADVDWAFELILSEPGL